MWVSSIGFVCLVFICNSTGIMLLQNAVFAVVVLLAAMSQLHLCRHCVYYSTLSSTRRVCFLQFFYYR